MSNEPKTEPEQEPPPQPQISQPDFTYHRGIGRSFEGPSATVVPGREITLVLHEDTANALEEIMSRTGDTPSSLFRKALGLYKLAEEAKRAKKAVGIAANPEALETEFVGL